MIAPFYRSYQNNTQPVDITVIGSGGKTTFIKSLLGNRLEGVRILHLNDRKISLRVSAKPYLTPHGDRIGLVVCKVTRLATLILVDELVEQLEKNNITKIFLLATHCDEDRVIMPDSLSFKAKMLNLEGVVEVNSLDKEDTLSAVKQLIADVLV